MARWVGRWLLGVGVLHVTVGCALYAGPLSEIAAAGFWNSVDDFSPRAAAFWFLLTGVVTLVLAACVDHLEAQQVR